MNYFNNIAQLCPQHFCILYHDRKDVRHLPICIIYTG
jgi:hypothetical protein